MSEGPKDFIDLPDELDYRSSSFYDLDDDVRSSECSNLYKKFTDLKSRYTEVEEIASGGMKRIYRAFDQKTGRYIALARLKEGMSAELHGSFIAEARLTAVLQHPNIIKVHEIGFDDEEQPYFTMDLKLGDSLADILGKLEDGNEEYLSLYPEQSLLMIFLKICDAVSYSHSQDILHLDIKPENIQVGEHGEVQLCDWGLARYTGEVEKSSEDLLDQDFLNGQTLDSEIKGTPGYLAPERITKNQERSNQTDIYSLGALLYSILTFKRPFEGEVQSILTKTIDGSLIAPKDRNKERNIPESLNAIVMKAMSLEPCDRYSSTKSLISDVKKHIDGFSTQAENAGFFKEISLFYKRNRKVCSLSIVFFVSLAVILFLFIKQLQSSRKKEVNLRKAAEVSQRAAEDNLQKYQEEKEMADLSFSTDPTAVIDVIKDSFRLDFSFTPNETVDRTMKTLKRIAESNKSEILIYEFKGDLHFIRQEFDLALTALRKGRGREAEANASLFDALEAVKTYKSEGKAAPIEIIKAIIAKLGGRFDQQIFRLAMYDKKLRNNDLEHFEVLKLMFLCVNKIESIEGFEYDGSTKTLRITGHCKQLNFRIRLANRYISLFSTLDIENLVLRGPDQLRPAGIQGLKLKTLDLRGIKIGNMNNFRAARIADKIYVTESLIDQKLLRKLQRVCEVIVEK